ncbi:Ubiquitin carboxyl-terminal hydrolase MINDY-3 [Holothuria leucospilota]|uniref:Ubiquitin carboxyl-terminal hydrolase MINDY n=1 Tax=Holothuria leucospilota TaxID=206669 RepID=A0A9Q0YRH3_HOLLE|nr:Ubiquitin carboxyl-terminal hydrolase MINDY-3 [Holothuria leucospilota]
MASTSQQQVPETKHAANPVEEVRSLIWGKTLDENVFARWCQGFIFSEDEPTALLQNEGGPCAIIAPLQAFIIKNLLFSSEPRDHWRNLEGEEKKGVLLQAMAEVFHSVRGEDGTFTLVCYKDKQELTIESVAAHSAGQTVDSTSFHSNLRTNTYSNAEDFHEALSSSLHFFTEDGGVLIFMYSVILTKGIDNIKSEMQDSSEPLIDGTFGHGSQSLINLMLTGRAISNIFDFEKDIAGFKMKGIIQQSEIGFLTLLENLRYCEVGSFLKSCRYPIWLLGSETHLTVFFTRELTLVAPETVFEKARRIFSNYDTEDSGFISTVLLGDVLQELNLVSIPEYVDIMKEKLDPDGTTIILQNTFMEEFFPEEPARIIPERFQVFHYNGLKRSCTGGKVRFAEGKASIPDPTDLTVLSEATPVLSCLRTKWPTIDIEWDNNVKPSLN